MTFRSSILYAFRLVHPPKNDPTGKGNGRKSLLGALACIGISLIPLVAVLVISDGMIQGITERIIGLSSRDISVYIGAESPSVKNVNSFINAAQSLTEVEGINQAFPEIQATALAAGKTARTGAAVRAVQNDIFKKDSAFASLFTIIEGKTELEKNNETIIGQKLANDLNLHVGDILRLITISSATSSTVIPRVTQFKIKGIVSCGYQELDALWVFIPLETGFSILPKKSSQFVIGLLTPDAFSKTLYLTQDEVQEATFGNRNIEPINYSYAYRWDEVNVSQYENFSSTKALLLLIMLLIVLVASVNISSALIMLVMERKKEIAILKSVGGTTEGIAMSFILTGFAAGTGGVIIGIPIGLLAAVNINTLISVMEKIVNVFAKCLFLLRSGENSSFSEVHLLDPAYYLQNIKVSVPLRELMIIAIGTLVLSLLVSVIPAIKAGKEKPIDTLRKL